MNIGIFTDTYEPQINGVVTSIATSINFLEKNHNVYVFCPNVKPKLKSTKNIWRFASVVYPFQKEYRLVLPFSKKLSNIDDLNLDIIHIHTPFSMGYIGLRIGKKLNIPVIHTYHTYFEKYLHYFPILPEKWVYKFAKKESERICNQCKLIIVPSNEMKQQLSHYKIDTPFEVIPSGISAPSTTKKDHDQFKQKFNLKNEPYCIFIGRIGFEKNIYFLIDAFKKITQTIPTLNLIIIGDGPEKKNLISIIEKNNLSSKIILTGYLDKKEVFTALNIASLMLFPSKTETQGLTVVESLITGTPVIGLNEMGVKNILENNQGGILTKESIDDYAAAAISLLNNQTLYETYVKKALLRSKDYDAENLTNKLVNAYKSISNK